MSSSSSCAGRSSCELIVTDRFKLLRSSSDSRKGSSGRIEFSMPPVIPSFVGSITQDSELNGNGAQTFRRTQTYPKRMINSDSCNDFDRGGSSPLSVRWIRSIRRQTLARGGRFDVASFIVGSNILEAIRSSPKISCSQLVLTHGPRFWHENQCEKDVTKTKQLWA